MPTIPASKLKEILKKEDLIEDAAFENLSGEASRMGQDVGDLLISRGYVTEDYFYNVLARYFGVERANVRTRGVDESALKLLGEEVARQKRSIIFAKEEDGTLDVAMEDPSDLSIIEFLEKHLKAKIKPFLAAPEDFSHAFVFYGRQLAQDFKKIIEENISETLRRKITEEKEAAKEVPIVQIVDNIISYAHSLKGSDIHIEILEDTILIRFRIDGVLREIIRIPKTVHAAIVARIKLLSSLKIDEHFKAQDGRFRYKVGSEVVDIRVSIMPVFYGEKVVMRLLTATSRPLSFDELGMLEDTGKEMEENIHKSYGMVLVCGPTGSGKTTTLYSVLNILNRPEVNIVTIEDPIEYDMRYVNQTQINPLAGVTFANGLRAILRQDPDIIMVGEIRDEETAEIAVHSALTGHLLLSTLHTNDAPTAIPRLVDMKIANFLVAAVLNMILAQRLVRRICLDCIESYTPSQDLLSSLETQLKEANRYSKIKIPKLLYRGKGCTVCGHSGYHGRQGIYEIVSVDEELRQLVISQNFSLDIVSDAAKKKGMITMFEDGLRKAETGITTIEEVLRVIRE